MRYLLLILSLFILSCGQGENKTVGSNQNNDTSSMINEEVILSDTAISGCYSFQSPADTAYLQLQVTDSNNITGQLSYNISGKDRNDGSLKAERRGDLIVAWYLFRSEGIISVRQEIFRIEKDRMIPATGKIIQSSDTTRFEDPAKLDFDNKRAFTRIPCVS